MIVQEGDPPRPGSYVVYTDGTLSHRHASRVLLMWSEGRWWYPLSDQKFRGHCYGWIGPLPAMELIDE